MFPAVIVFTWFYFLCDMSDGGRVFLVSLLNMKLLRAVAIFMFFPFTVIRLWLSWFAIV